MQVNKDILKEGVEGLSNAVGECARQLGRVLAPLSASRPAVTPWVSGLMSQFDQMMD